MLLGLVGVALISLIMDEYTPASIGFPLLIMGAVTLTAIIESFKLIWHILLIILALIVVVVLYFGIEETKNKKHKLLMIYGVFGIIFSLIIGSFLVPIVLRNIR